MAEPFGPLGEPGAGDGGELGSAITDRGIRCDPFGEQGPGNRLGKVTPDLTGMLKVHEPTSSAEKSADSQ